MHAFSTELSETELALVLGKPKLPSIVPGRDGTFGLPQVTTARARRVFGDEEIAKILVGNLTGFLRGRFG
ncbi:hypothetical protein [Streptomyces sp. NBC_00063]|uniref:hypothetical protein n=1 Tax=Streptomyces sp. NBC_00063 TaxID=2975638 RepID=UPI003D7439E6